MSFVMRAGRANVTVLQVGLIAQAQIRPPADHTRP